MATGPSTDSDFKQFLTRLRGLKIVPKKEYEASVADLERAWNENNKTRIVHIAKSVLSKIKRTTGKLPVGITGTDLTQVIEGKWIPKSTSERGIVNDQHVYELQGNKAELKSRGQDSSKGLQSKLPVKTGTTSDNDKAFIKCQEEVEHLKSENERLKEQLSYLQKKTGTTAIKDKANKNIHNEKLNAINEWYTNALNQLQVDVEKSNFDSDFNIKGDHDETNAAKCKIKAIRECMKKKIKDMERLEKYHSALQEVMEEMKKRLYALSQSKQPSNSAGKKGKEGKKNDERTTPDNKEVEKIVTDLESVMSKHKQNVEDIQAEVKQLQEEVHKESYGSNESKRTGPVFDSIKELRNKLRLKQDENKKGNKDDILKELCKLSDEVQTDKYDAKDYKGKGVGHDSIKIIRQNLIQMQEANKNWASSKEKLDKQIEDMKDMVSKFVFENCGEEKEKEAKTAFKNVKVQTPSTLIQLMLKEIKNVIDRLNTDDQEANTLAFSLVESACMLYATITGTEQVAVTSQTLMIQLNKVQVLHEKTTKKAEAVTEMVRMCNGELPIIYDKLMSIGFKQGAHPQEQNGAINKIKEYLNIIKHCVITTLESCIVVEQESVISTLEDMFKTVMGEQYKPTKSTHKVKEMQGNANDRNKSNETSTRETHAEFDNGFKVVINNMALVIIKRINSLETRAEHQNEQNRQMELNRQQMNAKLHNIQQTLESTENARLELLNRLSKVAGAKMVEGNPNIADLSDTNRPTKLSEKYSELYDNEWTDAFDIVSKLKKDEESAIKILLDILLEAYRFCENVSGTQTFVLRNALLCPTQKVDESHGKKGKEEYKLESIQAKMVADLRKQTAGESTKDLKTHFKKEKVTVAGVRDCHVYADKCIELCWLMCLQSPPVFIGTKFDQKGKFDTNVYKPYSKSGKKYEFQVWPPLYLHEGGPLLSKGVAQGKK